MSEVRSHELPKSAKPDGRSLAHGCLGLLGRVAVVAGGVGLFSLCPQWCWEYASPYAFDVSGGVRRRVFVGGGRLHGLRFTGGCGERSRRTSAGDSCERFE